MARVELNREMYEFRAQGVVCPPGVRVIYLAAHFGASLNPKASPFPLVDEVSYCGVMLGLAPAPASPTKWHGRGHWFGPDPFDGLPCSGFARTHP